MDRYVIVRSLLLVIVLCFAFRAEAQETSPIPGAQEQPPVITVVPNALEVNNVEFPAHTITIHGARANDAFKLWRNEIRAQSRDISGRHPTVARGVIVPELSPSPIVVMAEAKSDRKADLALLTLAFAMNDSTPLQDDGTQQRYMYDLAVKYNQAIVQDEIARKQKELDKAKHRSDKAASAQQKIQNKLQRAQDKLEQTRLKREQAQAEKAEIEGDVIGLQRKLEVTDKPRDQQRLLRIRRKLAKADAQVLKWMERESELQADVNKYNGQLPDRDRTLQQRDAEVERLKEEIDRMQVTRDSID